MRLLCNLYRAWGLQVQGLDGGLVGSGVLLLPPIPIPSPGARLLAPAALLGSSMPALTCSRCPTLSSWNTTAGEQGLANGIGKAEEGGVQNRDRQPWSVIILLPWLS